MGEFIQNKLNKQQFKFKFIAAFTTEIELFWKLKIDIQSEMSFISCT